MKTRLVFSLIFLLHIGYGHAQNGILVDHQCRDLSKIPSSWIDSAKSTLYIAYGHTSHGSQLITGMNALQEYDTSGLYNWSHTGGEDELHLFEGAGYQSGYMEQDCGYEGWADETREYLDSFPQCNVIIWSWCSQVNEVDLQSHYLDSMNQLESEYPGVTFVYMTGHLEGEGPEGSLFQANQQIRDYCKDHQKILYDFADIEKYSPAADTNYQVYGCDDGCNYDPDGTEPYDRSENWAVNWINANPDHEYTQIVGQCGSCLHSERLNCVLKGIAAWHLWARIAGWNGTDTTTFIADTGNWNNPANWDNGLPDSTMNVVVPNHTEVSLTSNSHCKNLTIQPQGTLMVSAPDDTLTAAQLILQTKPQTAVTGLLINQGFVDLTHGAHIERYAKKEAWTPLTSGLTNATALSFNAREKELYRWSENTSRYERITDNTTPLKPMQGYLFRNQATDTILTFQGSINQGGQDYELTTSGTDTLYKGWNMAGNPYTAPLDWEKAGWDKNHIANSFYYYPPDSSQLVAYVNGISNPSGASTGIIPGQEAFWVYAREPGTLSVDARAYADRPNKRRKANLEDFKSIKFRLKNNGSSYESLIIFNNEARGGFDPHLDAFHMPVPWPGQTVAPGLFSLDSAGQKLSINHLPEEERIRIFMGFSVLSSGEYSIEALEVNNLQTPLYLIDKVSGTSTKITSNGPYSFNASPGITPDRFILTNQSPTELDQPIFINHLDTDFSHLPVNWLDSARQNLHIAYGHTAHGHQLSTGMKALHDFFSDGRFAWSHSDTPSSLHLFEGDSTSQDGWMGMDCSTPGWEEETREYLEAHPECNVIMWAWSGLINTVSEQNIFNGYLKPMQQLETEYPGVSFIYMTGPLEGLGPNGPVKTANDSIRDFCAARNKILFDFADIEKYSPDRDVNYQEYGGNSACKYDPDGEPPYERSENWAENWVAQNPNDTLTLLAQAANPEDCQLSQTHCLNGVLKGIAAWHMWATIAGWEGTARESSVFTGDNGNWSDPANWDNGIPQSNTDAVIPNQACVTVASDGVCKTLTIQPEGCLILNHGATLSGEILTLKSKTDTLQTATLFNHGLLDLAYGARIERFFPGHSWTPISPPVSNARAGDLNLGLHGELYQWEVATGHYTQITDNSTPLRPMQGYLYRNRSNDTIITFPGKINQGTQHFNLLINPNNTLYQGWNLIGNPYCAPANWNSEGWDKSHIANSIYFYGQANGQPCAYVNGQSNPEGCSDGIIAPMETFWVYAHQEGTVSITDTALSSEPPSLKMTNDPPQHYKSINVQLSDGDCSYSTLIIFNGYARETFDSKYDALHMPVPPKGKPLSPGVFTLTGEDQKHVSINTRPHQQEFNIPLGMALLEDGSHSLKLQDVCNITDTLYITDNLYNKQVMISDSIYHFTQQAQINTSRFTLTNQLSSGNMTRIQSPDDNICKVYSHRMKIYIIVKKPIRAKITIVDMLGRIVYENSLMLSGTQTLSMKKTGYYIASIKTPEKTNTYKLAIF